MQIVGASWDWMGIAGSWRGGPRLVDSSWSVWGGLKQTEAGSANPGWRYQLRLAGAGASWWELAGAVLG